VVPFKVIQNIVFTDKLLVAHFAFGASDSVEADFVPMQAPVRKKSPLAQFALALHQIWAFSHFVTYQRFPQRKIFTAPFALKTLPRLLRRFVFGIHVVFEITLVFVFSAALETLENSFALEFVVEKKFFA